jgi:DNA-binding winged helix-turn-helix (wHTH) protein
LRQGNPIPDHRDRPSSALSYRVGEWAVHPNACRIVRDGREIKLTPKCMSVLDYLAARPRQVATHEELLEAFWRGAISSPNAVHKSVTELRHALGNGSGEADYIETIPKRSYRLVASVSLPPDPGELVPAAPKSVAVLRFRYTEGDPEHAYLAEGVAGALLECLSQTPELVYAVFTEKYYPAAVIDDPRYQEFLDEAGIGRAWSAHLREGVAELAPITGIEPSDPAPQRVWSR